MALVEPTKKGGRYTVKEQEERRIQVYHLHFEENKSAVKISELLDVNRNTINGDIAYWHSQLAHEFNAQDITAKMTKQIQRIEMQRDRLLEYLEDASSDEKFRIEKFVSEIDDKLVRYYSKMILNGKTILEPTISSEQIDENEIRGVVRDLIFSSDTRGIYSENDLKFNLIRETKCDIKHAEKILGKMKFFGLVLCEQTERFDYFQTITNDYSVKYNLEKFANMRGYVTIDELGEIVQKRIDLEMKIEKERNDFEQKFIQKYGPDQSKWSEEVSELFDLGEFE
ncbi:MAG: hypothetical protein K5777_04505 [Nitrosopumilus sp.]|nr:hypothetical protein [Nitrosopumilus sp.]